MDFRNFYDTLTHVTFLNISFVKIGILLILDLGENLNYYNNVNFKQIHSH